TPDNLPASLGLLPVNSLAPSWSDGFCYEVIIEEEDGAAGGRVIEGLLWLWWKRLGGSGRGGRWHDLRQGRRRLPVVVVEAAGGTVGRRRQRIRWHGWRQGRQRLGGSDAEARL
ncbi:hypothetical protein BHE74_00048177, partial [Ensete ventricosum]